MSVYPTPYILLEIQYLWYNIHNLLLWETTAVNEYSSIFAGISDSETGALWKFIKSTDLTQQLSALKQVGHHRLLQLMSDVSFQYCRIQRPSQCPMLSPIIREKYQLVRVPVT